MPAWAMISCASGYASTSRCRWSPIGGRPRPPWIRIGTRRSAASSKTGREPLVVEQELLRARMELDAAGAQVEAAPRLLDRPLVEREPDERDHPAVRALRERERAVVAGGEAGMPVGLVQAEHEAAGDAEPVHQLLELLVAADHPVDVVSEMDVRVEDVRVRRQLGPELVLPVGEQLLCTVERGLHP